MIIEQCEAVIKSIELQLVRVETCGCAEGYSRDGKHIITRANPCKKYIVIIRETDKSVLLQRQRYKIYKSGKAMLARILLFQFI